MKALNTTLGLAAVVTIILAAPGMAVALDCAFFPADYIWNAPIDTLPVHVQSDDYIDMIGAYRGLHPNFGSRTWNGAPIGIPLVAVGGAQEMVPVSFYYAEESDLGPYSIRQWIRLVCERRAG